MANTEDVSAPTPEMVGNAFVGQYYTVLCQAPENVPKFYQNMSVISRPGDDNSMFSESTLDGIDKMIRSLDYKNCLVEILTVDSQASVGEGVIVLVIGFFTGKDCLKRKFSQLFFLAPQEKSGYFVMNDVFRYVDGDGLTTYERTNLDDPAVVPQDELTNHAAIDPPTATLDEDSVQDVNSSHQLDNGKFPDADKEDIADHPDDEGADDATAVQTDANQNDDQPASESAASNSQEDAPKKSYASVANALNFKKQPFQQRALPAKPMGKPRVAATPPVTSSRPTSSNNNNNSTVERSNSHMVKGYSIFVANLPMNATPEQLRVTFEEFGPIKPDGVQVRSYKQEKNCFGFVEFESADSMKSALEASIVIGNRRAHIEEKKANNDGGKSQSRKGGFRNDSFRSRGNFPGHGSGRNEIENQEGISDQARGQIGETNSKNFPNGGGRVTRQAQVVQAQDGKN